MPSVRAPRLSWLLACLLVVSGCVRTVRAEQASDDDAQPESAEAALVATPTDGAGDVAGLILSQETPLVESVPFADIAVRLAWQQSDLIGDATLELAVVGDLTLKPVLDVEALDEVVAVVAAHRSTTSPDDDPAISGAANENADDHEVDEADEPEDASGDGDPIDEIFVRAAMEAAVIPYRIIGTATHVEADCADPAGLPCRVTFFEDVSVVGLAWADPTGLHIALTWERYGPDQIPARLALERQTRAGRSWTTQAADMAESAGLVGAIWTIPLDKFESHELGHLDGSAQLTALARVEGLDPDLLTASPAS